LSGGSGPYLTKTQWVYEELKRRIVDGRLRPGEPLVTTHIAREFGVSHIPVREAINRLRSEQLVWSNPHSHAVVSSLSKKDLIDVYEIRIALESLAVRLAAERMSAEVLQRLGRLVDEMERAAEADDKDRYNELNREFHLVMYSACQNPRLQELITDFGRNMDRFGPFSLATKRSVKESLREHRALLEALRRRDGIRAERLMAMHKRGSARALLEELGEAEGTPGAGEGAEGP